MSRSQPCSSSGAADEILAVQYLEQLNPRGITLKELEDSSSHAATPITKILFASIIEQSAGVPLEDMYTELGAYLDGEYEGGSTGYNITAAEVYSWINLEKCTKSRRKGLVSLFQIVSQVEHDSEFPCDGCFEGNGFARWTELQVHAARFMAEPKIAISNMVELLRFLRRRPLLDCTGNTQSGGLVEFDEKLEKARRLLPIIDKLADPAFVVIEPVAGGLVPAAVAVLLQTLAEATVCPFRSGHLPQELPDPAGRPGSVFGCVFLMHSFSEAQTFAGMLRTILADANDRGGDGPQTRVLALNTGAAGFRVY